MVAVGQDGEQVCCGVMVDADGEEVVDDEQVDVRQFVEELLVGDRVGPGQDELAGRVVQRT